MTDSNEIRNRLKVLLVKVANLHIEPEDVPDEGIIDGVGINSIASLEFLVCVEGEFGIEIADDDLTAALVDSLSTLATYVERSLAGTRERTE